MQRAIHLILDIGELIAYNEELLIISEEKINIKPIRLSNLYTK